MSGPEVNIPGPMVDDKNLYALNYTIETPYNGTIPTGGDSLLQDLNIFYDVREASPGSVETGSC